MFTHATYISPFTWRYGSEAMRQVWSEEHKRRLMRRVWVALAAAQHQAGLVSAAQLADLQAHQEDIDIPRALEIEQETRHDVMAEIRAFAEQCPVGGGIIHWGATSADITDNVDALRLREAAQLVLDQLRELLLLLAEKIESTAVIPTMALTHIQPAEPTTLGYRFAVYAQDLLEDYHNLQSLIVNLRGKGLKGAVGTQAGYAELLAGTAVSPEVMEAAAMAILELPYFPIATQTYTRQQDLRVQQVLAGIAASLHKFALDFRILQSPPFGEWAEPFGKGQVGSSAMPFKRNPINTENICSLARYVAGLPAMAWDNASQAILERSLDDSANRRIFQADGFLATDEMLRRAIRLVREMTIDEGAIARNMAIYGPFAATERVLMALVSAGASRQDAHEWIRKASLQAWAALREGQEGQENPLVAILTQDIQIVGYLTAEQVRGLMAAEGHVGTAVMRARAFAQTIRDVVGD
ncbi:MAG: adenylosuccinate lyase [Chloroflexi bacterium]|nr:adenylosuccinate lyase [Ardenticatenaceae bacterium]MBL1128834.1 adenylosuccinate lyase [Chloroflexota bacterium]NOG34912.1 adenylosuccinate lyase [Chloroflexota bacterium]GIK58075.1 MAG: adenylosuccinate lyase [Chloroflexota bacterium]